jgi:hypothetical protein
VRARVPRLPFWSRYWSLRSVGIRLTCIAGWALATVAVLPYLAAGGRRTCECGGTDAEAQDR